MWEERMNWFRRKSASVLVLSLLVVGCGEDSDPTGGAANNGATNNGAANNGAANNGATNNGAANNGATNNGATNNGATNNDCGNSTGSVTIVDPADGASFDADADSDVIEDGVQIDLRIEASAGVSVVTVTNETTSISYGGLAPEVLGVTLAEGSNVLRVFAPDPCVTSSAITVSYAAPQVCDDHPDCTEGQLCEEGVCQGCDAPCSDSCGACENGCCLGPRYQYVLVQDLTDPAAGRSPGADVDAISVISDQREVFAVSVEDSQIGQDGNEFADVTELLGPSDSECEVQNFTALGGLRAGGYVVVGFGNEAIENGDTIKVYEVGATLCGRFDDDPFRVSVGVSTDLGTFVEQGEGHGQIEFPVSGLE
jgi:hypothetical protein